MSKLRTENVNIIAEFLGSLMKAYARQGAKKTRQKIQNDPVIKKSLARIKQLDREIQQDIDKKLKSDPEFRKAYNNSAFGK
jgi:hypothetical protein